MGTDWLIPVLLIFGASQSCQSHSGLSCVNDYMTNVSCEWQFSAEYSGDNCKLKGVRTLRRGPLEKECKLERLSNHSNATRACSIAYASPRFSFAERLSLQVVCDGVGVFPPSQYHPGRHVKLQPPGMLHVAKDNLTWSRGSPFPHDIKTYEFQVQLRHAVQSWKDVEPRTVRGTFAHLDQNSMFVGEWYEARVRVKPLEPSSVGEIRGQWSDWSPSLSWSSEIGVNRTTRDTSEAGTPSLGLLLVIIGTSLLSLIICVTHMYKCVQDRSDEHVPDPSKYFQPLLSVHRGNFQTWLGPKHSYISSQACSCDISPVEISEASDSALSVMTSALLPTHQTAAFQQTGSNSQSSGFSNMGYFYSEVQSGSLCLESCPVYFTYQPEGGSSGTVQSALSYEHLQDQSQQQREPLSPDSGFDVGEQEEEEEEEEENEETKKEMCRGVNVHHLVSFVLSLPEGPGMPSSAVHMPTSFAPLPELSSWPEDTVVPLDINPSEPAEGAVARPSSMVLQPCTSGYLSLKEMQKYSNKSI
ncbi:interleukin-2 receptor subunit beta isoform X2 [Brachyhypopomus gauderio]